MLNAFLTFVVMVTTTCLVFAALGILSWQMAVAVLVGSGVGSALARARLPRRGQRPATPSASPQRPAQ